MSKCKICRSEFVKRSMSHKCCCPDCAIEYAKRERLKKERKEIRRIRLALKPRAKWIAEAQAEFNAYIRERDADLPCISCGRYHQGQYHAGHYRSVGAAPNLRFNEDNVMKQCAPCNNNKSGNVVEYRINLVKRIGLARVEALECNNEVKRWTIEDAKNIRATYKAKRAALAEQRAKQAA